MEQINLPTDYKRYKIIREAYGTENRKKITQEFLAQKANVNKSTISRIEKGELPITPDVIKAYSDVLNVSMEYVYGYSNSKRPDNARIGHDLGVTDEVADTMVMLKEQSNDEMNLTAVLNAFIGNKEATYDFMNTILMYMYLEHTSKDITPAIGDTFMTSTIIRYLNQYVKPQLKKVLETKEKCEDKDSETGEPTLNDYNILHNMIAECYREQQ